MPRIVLREFGKISRNAVASVLQVVEECYSRLEPHGVELVDLLVFDTSRGMEAYFTEERGKLGILSEDFGVQFYAMHEAWTGIPRIWVCIERMKQLERVVRAASLRHEVGHSVLHGTIEYYALLMPSQLSNFSRRMQLPREYGTRILYFLSVAVKDYEVILLLAKRGYLEDQRAYARKVLSASAEDIASWRISEGHPEAMALCLVARLKDLAATLALEKEGAIRRSRQRTLVNELSYLPPNILEMMVKTADEFSAAMGGDTFQNLNATAKVIVDELLEPLFSAGQT